MTTSLETASGEDQPATETRYFPATSDAVAVLLLLHLLLLLLLLRSPTYYDTDVASG
jgi:hypothetical protein